MNTIKILCLNEHAEEIVKLATSSRSSIRTWSYKIEPIRGTVRSSIIASNNEHLSKARLDGCVIVLNTLRFVVEEKYY